eukprot:568197_1
MMAAAGEESGEPDQKIVLGYWAIRGVAQPIRFMLEYGKIPYEDRQYGYSTEPPYKNDWFGGDKEKNEFGLDFPNLPYFVDGDVSITESNAILTYISEKFKIGSTDLKSRARVGSFIGRICDWRKKTTEMAYRTGEIDAHREYTENSHLTLFEKAIGDNPWLCGEKIEACDFLFYEVLFWHSKVLYKDILEKYPKLEAFMKRFESLDAIKGYLKSDRFSKQPLFGPMAKFGGTVTY